MCYVHWNKKEKKWLDTCIYCLKVTIGTKHKYNANNNNNRHIDTRYYL